MTEVPAALNALASDPTTPVKLLIVGGVGVGKSTMLATARDLLRGAGVDVLGAPEPGAAAVVVDDAHQLTETQLGVLTDLATSRSATVIVAAEPREHDAGLRALMAVLDRENPRVRLGAWTLAELSRRLPGLDRPALAALLAETGGLPLLVEAARAAPGGAHAALVDRLRRLDEPEQATLLIMSLSPALGPADIAAVLGTDAETARVLADAGYATGLLDAAHRDGFGMAMHRAVAQLLGAARHREIESALLRTQTENSTLSTDLAVTLAEHGFSDPQLAAILEERAAGGTDSVRLLRAAVDARGRRDGGVRPLLVRLADASACRGDCADATALTDELLETGDPAVRGAAVRIAASVAAHDGKAAQAAELFGWLGRGTEGDHDEMVATAGTIVSVAVGDVALARTFAGAPGGGPPTSSARAARSLSEGLLLTLDAPYPVAVARLGQAIGRPGRSAEAMPDTAAALLTLAALHAGDPVRARSVIARAAAEPDPVFGHRHRLLLAWAKMQDGQLAAAGADVAALPAATLHRRDALWATALQAGIARRAGDTGALQRHWFGAMEVLAEYSVDLFSLLPLGELWVAAARLRQTDRLSHQLDQAFGLLAALGDPPSWSLPLHWAGVHAAILASSPESMAPHGQALTAAAGSSGFAAALAGAGRAWLRVLARQVDLDEVAAAARTLAQFGLTWDGTRLAGQAALQAPDSRVAGAMLQIARDLKLVSDDADPAVLAAGPDGVDAGTGPVASPAPQSPSRSVLSEREREVAELLLLGMPYRDIGAQLFISAKTVEHHVARIRRRIGAESRSEMLSMLRAMVAPPG